MTIKAKPITSAFIKAAKAVKILTPTEPKETCSIFSFPFAKSSTFFGSPFVVNRSLTLSTGMSSLFDDVKLRARNGS